MIAPSFRAGHGDSATPPEIDFKAFLFDARLITGISSTSRSTASLSTSTKAACNVQRIYV